MTDRRRGPLTDRNGDAVGVQIVEAKDAAAIRRADEAHVFDAPVAQWQALDDLHRQIGQLDGMGCPFLDARVGQVYRPLVEILEMTNLGLALPGKQQQFEDRTCAAAYRSIRLSACMRPFSLRLR